VVTAANSPARRWLSASAASRASPSSRSRSSRVGQRAFCRKPGRADLGELGGQHGRPAFQLVGPRSRCGRRRGRSVEFFGQVLAAVPFVDLRDRLPGLPHDPNRTLPELRIELPACLWHDHPS
jgi:hypothetical protein